VAALKTPTVAGELCAADCDFEESALESWRPLMPSAAWDKASGLGGAKNGRVVIRHILITTPSFVKTGSGRTQGNLT